MGCDIHCYVEYKRKDQDSWRDFGKRINPGRNYWMFGMMAGVRLEVPPVVEPRGIPNDLAYAAFDDWAIYVSDTQQEATSSDGGTYSYSKAHAEDDVAKGYCQWVARGSQEKSFVTNCDWHTPSWLTADEFEQAIGGYLVKSGFQIGKLRLCAPETMSALAEQKTQDVQDENALRYIEEYWAILAAMRCFELQGLDSRLVFWFDN